MSRKELYSLESSSSQSTLTNYWDFDQATISNTVFNAKIGLLDDEKLRESPNCSTASNESRCRKQPRGSGVQFDRRVSCKYYHIADLEDELEVNGCDFSAQSTDAGSLRRSNTTMTSSVKPPSAHLKVLSFAKRIAIRKHL
mmetsp:Transcript_10221/g.27263  ORF Transcript_10221/g.27263 Transcript_10221/m.27263 type:complete len:141 (-) Transcript_10221:137-559(-)